MKPSMHNLRRLRSNRFLLLVSTIIGSAGAQPAFAQSGPTPPPVFQNIDDHGVDLATQTLILPLMSVSIGPGGPGSLGFNWGTDDATQRPEIYGYVDAPNWAGPNETYVVFGGSTQTFSYTGSQSNASFTQDQANGSSLSYNQSTDTFTFVGRDGSVATFTRHNANDSYWIRSLAYPNGQTLRYFYTQLSSLYADGNTYTSERLTAIASSLGYQVRLEYTSKNGVQVLTKSVAFNMANENCSPSAATCSLNGTWPIVTRDVNSLTLTDGLGRKTSRYYDGNGKLIITLPSGRQLSYTGSFSSSYSYLLGVTSFSSITSFSDGRGVWQYRNYGHGNLGKFRPGQSVPETFQFNPAGQMVVHNPFANSGLDEQYGYDGNNRLTTRKITDGTNSSITSFSYDPRGNLTQSRQSSITPGTPADLVTTATFPSSCVNAAVCNNPTASTDAKGNETDYAYTAFGAIQSVTYPAGLNGVRPTTNYSYAQVSASFGGASGDPVWLLAVTSTCRTQANCAGTADEVRFAINHDPSSALLPTAMTRSAGDGSLTATTTIGYTPTGDVNVVDGPLPGSADTVRHYYDAMREETGIIGPDTDGSGPLHNRAVRKTYTPDGQISTLEQGTATGQGDGDMGGFVSLQTVSTTYDAQGRSSATSLSVGGTTYALDQIGYNDDGSQQCATARMNAASFGSEPSACTLGTQGSSGTDRIKQYAYDGAGRLVSVTDANGTSNQVTSKAIAYDSLGRVQSLTDANSNVTSYAYDGLNRPSTVTYPGGSYDQLGYDSNGNVTSRQLRDGNSITFSYDALNRVATKKAGSEPQVSYSYDLLGHTTLVSRSADGINNTLVWDALGRLTSDTQPFGSLTYQYDAAGRRVRATWNDGFYATYDYDVLGEVTAIHENGGLVLASFAYDDLGRRASLSRANGTITTYGYDAVSRLTSLVQDLAGSANDLSLGFAYNPAGQITSRTSSNGGYAFTGSYNVSRAYSVNGLNQYTQTGSITPTYDGRGNLTSAGSATYGYGLENLLKSASGQATLYYDALGRLQEYDTSVSTRFAYDGGNIASEVANPSGAILRRYVYGPGSDEPLVWYEGSGTSDRRYLHSDERGSVIAVSDGNGNAITINSYDEYGIPGSGNSGRFQYTGQAWLPEIGMQYSKARIYSPTLGRFLQTDPIGYTDGMNWYNYVGGDPINNIDPTGFYCDKPDAGAGKQGGTASVGSSELSPADCQAAKGTYLPDITVNGRLYVSKAIDTGTFTFTFPSPYTGNLITLDDVHDQDIVIIAKPKKAPKKGDPISCDAAAQFPGKFITMAADGTFGLGKTYGKYFNDHSYGNFQSLNVGSPGGSAQTFVHKNMQSLIGINITLSLSLFAQYTLAFDTSFNLVAQGAGVGNGEGFGGSHTTLTQCFSTGK